MSWQLAEAKNRLSEVINRALEEGSRRITRRGDAVVLVAEAEHLHAVGKCRGFVPKRA